MWVSKMWVIETFFSRASSRVSLDIGSGIKNRRDTFIIIANEIRKLGNSFGLDAFKDE